jgi:casein kinase 1/casein kinase I family protein HRR25
MIMDLLGPNLQDLMVLCGGRFSLKTSLLLIIQIVSQFLLSSKK